MENNSYIKDQLIQLNNDFKTTLSSDYNSISEEKIRSGFLNKLFELFGWNLSDITEVVEEKPIKGIAKDNLDSINSDHKKPDYMFCEKRIPRLIFDAKNITEDFQFSKADAFQIRSYSWSMNLPIAMISNFEKFGVYNTTFKPNKNQEAQFKAIFFTIDDLIENFDEYSKFFFKENVQNQRWDLSTELSNELKTEKSKTLDVAFFELLENFRLSLGQGIYEQAPSLSPDKLNYYTQIIINRILFIRFLEDLNIETRGTLESYLKTDNFWVSFTNKTKSDFELKYDGALFSEVLPSFTLSNDVFKNFISEITINTPYRFDVIKPSFIAEIYDQFLGRQLSINNSDLRITNKPLSPEGAVPTPYELSHYICKQTIKIEKVNTVDDLLNIKIIDPCVGSGSFLLAALELLVDRYKEITKSPIIYLNDVKLIIKNCLYGIDIDPSALEVLKMTLSLKIVSTDYKLPEPFEKILSKISQNFKFGNTVVQDDASNLESEEFDQSPTNLIDLFPEIMEHGGFDYLVTNPPYIEPKHFKKKWPNTHSYLKNKYELNEKVDSSMFFLKRIYDLINEHGKYGIVIQKRFFKTEYGKKIRNFLSESGNLFAIHDFDSNGIFKGKITYIACLFGASNKNTKQYHSHLTYYKHSKKITKDRTNLSEIINTETDLLNLKSSILKDRNWSFESLKFADCIDKKLTKPSNLITLDNLSRLNIGVGPQVLDSKFYFLRKLSNLNNNLVETTNRRKEKVTIERELLRPVLKNNHPERYSITRPINDYIIFPYNNDGTLIPISNIQKNFPYGYQYLNIVNNESNTNKVLNKNEFYRYTRETKLNSFDRPKIFIPMTIKNVTASLSENGLFGDNSNINTLLDQNDDIEFLKAMCIIFNSEMFNDLALVFSGEASHGYRKLNKQFLKLVPVPIINSCDQSKLAHYYDEITKLKEYVTNAYGEKQNHYKNSLKKIIVKANNEVNSLYNFSNDEINDLKQIVERL
ncbi:MAG: N-6 DNA methylase [Streptococcus salivarius]|nr:N-6 DNA methylase [Streptococcus salivarius]